MNCKKFMRKYTKCNKEMYTNMKKYSLRTWKINDRVQRMTK